MCASSILAGVLAVLAVAAFVIAIIGRFAVPFTGAWPQGLRDFLVSVGNYYLSAMVYVVVVYTSYPRFGPTMPLPAS